MSTIYAKNIGRVGALAVAPGIGAAVSNTPGVAWASPDSPRPRSPSNPSSESSSSTSESMGGGAS
jgi:hypothetical protein